jgi:hypothetical protein
VPNGKPGDHPLADILVHGLDVFCPRVDTLIREIVSLGGRFVLDRNLDLRRADPRFPPPDGLSPDLPTLERRLTLLRDGAAPAASSASVSDCGR